MQRSIVLFLCATASAFAHPTRVKPDNEQQLIDAQPVLGKLVALRDDLGGIYILPAPGSFDTPNEAGEWVFYGDTKVVYQQRSTLPSPSPSNHHFTWEVWAPRSESGFASFGIVNDQPTLTCKKAQLTKLTADETRVLFQDLKFYPPLWKREPRFLARDEDGIYYYVDQLSKKYGGNGHRVYVGQKGSMEELAMTNVVSDSAGDIYATKSGQLKILADKGTTAFWLNRRRKRKLTVLEVRNNRYLIYRDLGIYGRLGTVCDDL